MDGRIYRRRHPQQGALGFPASKPPPTSSPSRIQRLLDDAFRDAHLQNTANWCAQDYSLNPLEIAQLIAGTAAEYKVTEVA